MCIQEHQLHEYEKAQLEDLFPDYSCDARAYDEVLLLDPSHKPSSGRGGVATFWKKIFDPYITQLPKEGNVRILVIIIAIPGNTPICLINCYLPSGNTPCAIELYLEDIDVLHELLCKYKYTHLTILTGDLNEDHHNRNHVKERKMKELIKEHCLHEACLDFSHEKTYINPNLGHASHIDHVLVASADTGSLKPATLMPEDDIRLACNLSTHRPLSVTLTLNENPLMTQKSKKPGGKNTTSISYPLKKMNEEIYKETLDQEIGNYDLSLVDHEFSTQVFQQCMKTAIISSTPGIIKSQRPGNKKGRKDWSPELADAEAKSKIHFHHWKMEGRPKSPHPTHQNMIAAKKLVKRITRAQDKAVITKRLSDIEEASEYDQKLFHELVQLQQKTLSGADSLIVDGQIITDEDEIRTKWAEYFEKLGTPKAIDEDDAKTVEQMRALCDEDKEFVEITPELVKEAIKRLNCNKAKDIYGLAAEHLKFMSESSINSLTEILSNIINYGKVPEILKASYKINIPKKNKDPRFQDHHRGITVAPIISKLLEVLADMLGLEMLPQNKLQFGFSHGRSPTMCSLIISEAISEARATKSPLASISEDARKAFDVVDQNLLKMKLYHSNVPKKIWRLIDDIYSGGTEQFRYRGILSHPYTISQGVKQGGVDSPTLYKLYVYAMLNHLEENGLGLHIGPIYLGSPTCADDVELLSSEKTGRELQLMLSTTKQYSTRHKYEIHPTKSTGTILYETKSTAFERQEWFLSNDPIPMADEFDHLGLTWQSGKTKPNLELNVSAARRTSYKLMGAGFHGVEGLNPVTSMKLVSAYVMPRLLLGLEAVVLNKTDVSLLDKYHRKLLRQLQSLPDSTSNAAVYLLVGSIPVEGEWHKRVLSLYGRVTRLGSDHPLYLLAARQLSLGASNRPHSWFTQVNRIGAMYDIDITEVLKNPWSKEMWKFRVKNAINSYWKIVLLKEAKLKSTLKWLIHSDEDAPHGVWEACRTSPHLVAPAAARAKALVGRLCINEHSWRDTNMCPLCEDHDETMTHFLTECKEAETVRTERISKLLSFYEEEGLPPPQNRSERTSAILNGDRYLTQSSEIIQLNLNVKDAHNLASSLCYQLLKNRDYIINEMLMKETC